MSSPHSPTPSALWPIIVPLAEVHRVLTPRGVVIAANPGLLTAKQLASAGFEAMADSTLADGRAIVVARKPWPKGMDEWSHPRHAADGNAVSADLLVGPPERARWVAGATDEVEGMVTAGGPNFYGGLLARDSFNGLRLWHYDLRKAEHNEGHFTLPRITQARPIASTEHAFAIVKDKLVALDALTGKVVREFAWLSNVTRTVLHADQLAFEISTLNDHDLGNEVRIVSSQTGEPLWDKAFPPGTNHRRQARAMYLDSGLWILHGAKTSTVDKSNAFARVNTGGGTACVPRGSWTYGARHQYCFPGEASRRPLAVFRDNTVFTSLDGTTEIFRRDFNLEQGETFSSKWITGWEAATKARDGGKPYRSYRLAEMASWTADLFTPKDESAKPKPRGAQLYNELHAMALSGDGRLFVAHRDGRLKSIATSDGQLVTETRIPTPAWDGLAIAGKRVFLTTQTGELICLGERDGRQ